jgi:hypothetical protein
VARWPVLIAHPVSRREARCAWHALRQREKKVDIAGVAALVGAQRNPSRARASLLMSHDRMIQKNVALIGRVSDRQGEEEPRALACPADQCQIATVGLRERFRERQA